MFFLSFGIISTAAVGTHATGISFLLLNFLSSKASHTNLANLV